MERIRLAIVGIGHLGRWHVEKALANQRCQLVATVEPRPERRAEYQAKLPDVRHLAALDELFAPGAPALDAALLAAPTGLHGTLGAALLERGLHLLIEKPLAATVAEGLRLVELARRQGRVLQVGMSERFNPAVEAALQIADRPRYMVAERLAAFSPRSLEVDVIRDLMVHDLDILLALVGAPVAEVRAVGVPLITDKVDMANVRLEFADGAVAQLTASRASLAKARTIRLFTLSQYLSIDCDARTVKSVQRLPPPPGSPFPLIQGQPVEFDASADPLTRQLDNFLDAIAGAAQPRVGDAAGLTCLELAERISAELRIPLPASFHP